MASASVSWPHLVQLGTESPAVRVLSASCSSTVGTLLPRLFHPDRLARSEARPPSHARPLSVDDPRRRPPLPARGEAAAGNQDGERPVEHRPQPPAREPAPHAPVRRQAGGDREPAPDPRRAPPGPPGPPA